MRFRPFVCHFFLVVKTGSFGGSGPGLSRGGRLRLGLPGESYCRLVARGRVHEVADERVDITGRS